MFYIMLLIIKVLLVMILLNSIFNWFVPFPIFNRIMFFILSIILILLVNKFIVEVKDEIKDGK